jgi:hypothetical protein
MPLVIMTWLGKKVVKVLATRKDEMKDTKATVAR